MVLWIICGIKACDIILINVLPPLQESADGSEVTEGNADVVDKDGHHTTPNEPREMAATNEEPSSVPVQPPNGEIPSSGADGEEKKVNGENVIDLKDNEKATQGSTPDNSCKDTSTEKQSDSDTKAKADDPVHNGHDAGLQKSPNDEQNSSSLRESSEQNGADVEMVKETVAAVSVGDATAETIENGSNDKEQQPTEISVNQPTKTVPDFVNGSVPDGDACKSAAGNADSGVGTEETQPLPSTSGVSDTANTDPNGVAP